METAIDKLWAYFGVFTFLILALGGAIRYLYLELKEEIAKREEERAQHREEMAEERKDNNDFLSKVAESIAVIRFYVEKKL